MKNIQFILLESFLVISFSCEKSNNVDTTSEPDMVVENRTGTLRYYEKCKMWGIGYYYPGTIDAVDIYLIEEVADNNVVFKEGAKVQFSGSCYRLDLFQVNNLIGAVHAETDVYYITVSELTDVESSMDVDLIGEPDMVVKNVSGTLSYYEKCKMWGIRYHHPGTIDDADIYLIKEVVAHNVIFKEGAKVQFSGSCYRLDLSQVNNLTGAIPVGVDVYYIAVFELTAEESNIDVDLGDSDIVVENRTGTLRYYEKCAMWGISYHYQGTYDSVDIYLIKKTVVHNVVFKEGAKVQFSGSCYRVDLSQINNLTGAVPAGTDVYYIIISKLTN